MPTFEEVFKERGYSVIGHSVPKKDGWVKVTGEAKFADDLYFPGMLHGKLLHSPHPHAKIMYILIAVEPKNSAGVRGIVTGKEFPGILYGNFSHTRDYLPLAIDRVRYIGEEVAAVAAVDLDTAEEALDLIQVEYEPLPAVFDPEEAMQPGAPQLYDHAPNNVAAESHFQFGDVEKGFAESDYLREDVFETQAMKHAMLEPPCLRGPLGCYRRRYPMVLQVKPLCGLATFGDGVGDRTRQSSHCPDLYWRKLLRRQAGSHAHGFLRRNALQKDRAAREVRAHHG